MTIKNNLELWDKVKYTDPKQTKPAKIGQMRITAICPQFQRKNATAMFGPYGIGWGIVPESEQVIYRSIGTTELASYTATMFYEFEGRNGTFPICSSIKLAYMTSGSSGYLKIDDDYMKKLQTDALTKGLSFLGFNSDVFEGLFDDSRYVAAMNEQFAERIDNTVELRQDYIDKAFKQYQVEVENEVYSEEGDFKKVQQINHYLTNDERIAVMEMFGKETVPNSKKMLKSVLKDLLAKKEENNE